MGTVTGMAQVRLSANASGIMTGHRPFAAAVYVDDVQLVDAELCAWAGIERRATTESLRRELPVDVGDHQRSRLCFRGDWETVTAWFAQRGIGLTGWVHTTYGTWVPAEDPDAPRRRQPGQPCAQHSCGLPVRADDDHPGMCARHVNGARRAAANAAARAEAGARMAQRWDRDARNRKISSQWAQTLQDRFGIDAVAGDDGRVAVSGEGLAGLLTQLAAEIGGDVLAELTPAELQLRQDSRR